MGAVLTNSGASKLERLKGSEWKLSTRPPLPEAVRDVPGLRVHEDSVTGMIDAVAAAAKLLGTELPSDLKSVKHERVHGLRRYQVEGVNTMLRVLRTNGGALLADDVGLGKTRQAIAIADILRGRVLIVCPAHCRSTWADEIRTITSSEDFAVLGPATNKAQQAAWDEACSKTYVITSYELADKAIKAAFNTTLPNVLIMDEAHYLCGRKTKRANALESIARLTNYRLALSATPMYSRPRDFYKLLKVLFGARFGTPTAFDLRYAGGAFNQWGGIDNKGASNLDELKLRLSYYMVRREKRDVLKELPPITRQVMWVDGTDAAKAAFAYAMNEERSEKAVVNALVATLDEKLDTCVALARDAQKFLLFTYLKRHARELHRRLVDSGTPCVLITGDNSSHERAEIARTAAKNGWGVVATIDSAGTGLNVLRDVAGYGIMHSIPWVPNQAIQAEGRLHRMGQKENVHWVYVAMRDSMDEVVVGTVINKLDAVRAVMPSTEESRALRDSLDDSKGTEDALKAIYDSL